MRDEALGKSQQASTNQLTCSICEAAAEATNFWAQEIYYGERRDYLEHPYLGEEWKEIYLGTYKDFLQRIDCQTCQQIALYFNRHTLMTSEDASGVEESLFVRFEPRQVRNELIVAIHLVSTFILVFTISLPWEDEEFPCAV
jgi:hypothetical protein